MRFESNKRTALKAGTYRIIHYLIHLAEAYLAIKYFSVWGHWAPVIIVAVMQILCTAHYVIHEWLFSLIKWGYIFEETNQSSSRRAKT